jgi:sporulation protein YlmC with PRC-barrel domain
MEKRYLSRDKIVGKQVVDSDGMIVGTIQDVGFDLKAKDIALHILTKTGEETVIPGNTIAAAGDVILLGRPLKPTQAPSMTQPTQPAPQQAPAPSQPPQPQAPGLCPSCGYQNDPSSRFCIKCGTRLR